MIPKSGNRFSEKIMLEQQSMISKSGNRFSEKIMLEQQRMISKVGIGFRKDRARTIAKRKPPFPRERGRLKLPAQRDRSEASDAYRARSGRREIDDAPAHERSAIRDPNRDRAAIPLIGDADMTSEWKRLVSGRQRGRIHALAACGSLAGMSVAGPVDRCESGLGVRRSCENKTNCKRQCVGSCLHPTHPLVVGGGGRLPGEYDLDVASPALLQAVKILEIAGGKNS
jgi:hypothetical protein